MSEKKRGRPPLGLNGSVCASLSLPIEQYDEICRVTQKQRISISACLRDLVEQGSRPVVCRYLHELLDMKCGLIQECDDILASAKSRGYLSDDEDEAWECLYWKIEAISNAINVASELSALLSENAAMIWQQRIA